MIEEPGIGTPVLGNPHGPGDDHGSAFPVPGRLNRDKQPPNNLGLSGARVAHLHTAKEGAWPPYSESELRRNPKNRQYSSPVRNPDEPKSVWPYVLQYLDPEGKEYGTAVQQACRLDPSLLLVVIGNNDALNAAMASDLAELTAETEFRKSYDALVAAVRGCSRADVVTGTIPAMAAIPQMVDVGSAIGPVPFTVPLKAPATLLMDEETATRGMERCLVSLEDPRGRCHGGVLPTGGCNPKTDARVSVATIFKKKLRVLDGTGKFGAVRQSWGDGVLHLEPTEVLNKSDLATIRTRTASFNDYIRSTAAANGFAVMDVDGLFTARSTTLDDPAKLNSLYTGTPRFEPLEWETFSRGRGNSILSWDGVHPNNAGYSVVANEAIRVINNALAAQDFGGLEKGAAVQEIDGKQKAKLLTIYMNLTRSRIWHEPPTFVE
jgi:lysophospholipase L1-like esterase